MLIWLIGAGPMAGFHAEVLAALGTSVTIVATSATRAAPLAQKHGMAQFTKGLTQALAVLPRPEAAVIALPVDLLAQAALQLAQAGVPRILIEKPGALTATELDPVHLAATASGAQVFIAYNRRFFASVQEARRRITQADSVLSVCFEFCEDADRIAVLPTPAAIKQNWVLANSSHVIDLAFHLCGTPGDWQHQVSGSLPWHSSAADFRGMGHTKAGASFSYYADWRGPGRWGIEIILPQERLILRPMEALSVMHRGSFTAQPVALEDAFDKQFKPGLYAQMVAFLAESIPAELVQLAAQIAAMRDIYNPIAHYTEEAGR